MKILAFLPYIPYPIDRGTFQRAFHLLKALAQEHEVHLFALAEDGENMDQKPVFEAFCKEVEFISFEHPEWEKLIPGRLLNSLPASVAHWTLPHVAEALAARMERHSYDLAHVYDLVLAQYFVGTHDAQPIVLDRTRVDLQFQLMEHARLNFSFVQRLLRYEAYAKLWLFERKLAKRALVEVVCGPDDVTFLRRYVSEKMPIEVVVNGVDLEFFHPAAVGDARESVPTVLFCGAMDYSPNVDALRWYFSTIHDRLLELVPGLQVWIVGKAPVAEVQAHGSRPGVTVTGGVPDVRPYYRRAWMQIVPLQIGGGTRLKIVESMAIGTPVVSTTIGAQGLDLVHGEDILLADTPEDFAQQTARALKDPELRGRIEAQGIQKANARFSWTMIGRRLGAIYQKYFDTARG